MTFNFCLNPGSAPWLSRGPLLTPTRSAWRFHVPRIWNRSILAGKFPVKRKTLNVVNIFAQRLFVVVPFLNSSVVLLRFRHIFLPLRAVGATNCTCNAHFILRCRFIPRHFFPVACSTLLGQCCNPCVLRLEKTLPREQVAQFLSLVCDTHGEDFRPLQVWQRPPWRNDRRLSHRGKSLVGEANHRRDLRTWFSELLASVRGILRPQIPLDSCL